MNTERLTAIAELMVNYIAEEDVRSLPWDELDDGSKSLYIEAISVAFDETEEMK